MILSSRSVRSATGLGLASLAMMLSSCGVREIRSAKEVAGEYAFHFKSGQVEVFTLRENFTYRQELYKDLPSYKSFAKAEYTNDSTWSYSGNRLVFKTPLSVCEWPDPARMREKPELYEEQPGTWLPPSRGERGSEAQIEFSPDFYYVLVRVADRKTFE